MSRSQVSIASPQYALDEELNQQKSLGRRCYDTLVFMDAAGLILLGFAWSLILLPFTLAYSANGGWKNASMIAMEVVGILLLITFTAYEFYWVRCTTLATVKLKLTDFTSPGSVPPHAEACRKPYFHLLCPDRLLLLPLG